MDFKIIFLVILAIFLIASLSCEFYKCIKGSKNKNSDIENV